MATVRISARMFRRVQMPHRQASTLADGASAHQVRAPSSKLLPMAAMLPVLLLSRRTPFDDVQDSRRLESVCPVMYSTAPKRPEFSSTDVVTCLVMDIH